MIKDKVKLTIFLILLLFSGFIFTTCINYSSRGADFLVSKNTGVKNGQMMVVAASIIPVGEFTKKIGDKKIEVIVMVPPGADPHTYEPKPRQFEALSKALMYVKVGSGIDFELALMEKITEINSAMIVINCSEGIEMLDNNPHIWLSPKNAKIIVQNIYEGIIKIDPENISLYEKNKENFVKELDILDKEISEILKDKKNRKFMVYHPAWGYFARDYNLEQISIEYEGKEPTLKSLSDLIAEAKKYKIKVIFASPQFSTKSADVIADEIGAEVILVDPLGSNYIDNIKTVARALANYLE